MKIYDNIYSQLQEESKEFQIKSILFVVYPFLSFLLSLLNARSRSSYLIFFLFGVVFCWHMNPTGLGQYDDLIGIMERVISSNFTTSEIWDQTVAFFTFAENSPKELYENILIWFTKLFSQNPHLFFAFASIPYLYFMLKSLKQITDDQKFANNIYCLIILVLFVLPRDIITVQNPRFTTGVWMVVFSTIMFFSDEKYRWRYFLLILLTPAVHSGFWFYVIVFIGGLLVMRFRKLTIWLLYFSVPFSYLSYDLLSNFDFAALPLPTMLSDWAIRYMSEESFNKHIGHAGASGFFWVSQAFNTFCNTMYLFIPYYLWKYRDEIDQRTDIKYLFDFFLYFYAVVNFIQFIPVLGGRFYWIVRILGIFLWFKVVFPRHQKVLLFLLCSCSWEIFRRYFYTGAVYTCVPLEIFYAPLPFLISDFWNVTTM
ncbi:hypothetical protein EVD33_13505 [Bacteroidales bacterium SW292]|nr:hypothetical protein [Bacteroidales bacterium SW292]